MIDILPRVNPKKILAMTLLAALAFGAAGCSQTLTAGAAVVNGVSISQEALDKELAAQGPGAGADNVEAARQTLQGLIQQELLRQAAVDEGITATAAEVDERFQEVKAQTPDFDAQLAQAGLTEATLRDRLRVNLLAEGLADKLIGEISDADLREVYNQEKEQFREVRGRDILFTVDESTTQERAERQARAALTDIRSGTSFARLARRLSDDPATRDSGGLLRGQDGGPWFSLSPDVVDQTFAEALWGARVGRAGGPVADQRGYHVYLVTRKRYKPFAEAREQLRQQLEQDSRSAALQDLLTKETAAARILVNPRIGDWDEETRQIVPHEAFVPAEPVESVPPPGGVSLIPGS